MAEVAEPAAVQSPPARAAMPAAPETIPIEERTDVTVDELENTSLPYPAELYHGKVVYKMANPEHGTIQCNLSAELKNFLRDSPVGMAMTETNFQLWPDRPRESRIPDIAFVRKERLPEDLRRFPRMAPDLAIEILSPEDKFLAAMNKVDAYLEQGTQIVWLVIPDTREVLICTADEKRGVRDVLTAPELLPGFEVPVERILEGLPEPVKV